jgi:hypothetical protein
MIDIESDSDFTVNQASFRDLSGQVLTVWNSQLTLLNTSFSNVNLSSQPMIKVYNSKLTLTEGSRIQNVQETTMTNQDGIFKVRDSTI